MADLSITGSAIRGIRGDTNVAGATITAGETVYKDNTNAWQLSDCNNTSAAAINGITLTPADTGQPVIVHTAGALVANAVFTAGTFYYVSATPGKICPFGDLTTGCRVIQVGYAINTTTLVVNFIDTGIVLP